MSDFIDQDKEVFDILCAALSENTPGTCPMVWPIGVYFKGDWNKAAYLSALITMYNSKQFSATFHDGLEFVECPHGFITKHTGITDNKQRAYAKEFVDKGLIRTLLRGKPPRKYLHMNGMEIFQIITGVSYLGFMMQMESQGVSDKDFPGELQNLIMQGRNIF